IRLELHAARDRVDRVGDPAECLVVGTELEPALGPARCQLSHPQRSVERGFAIAAFAPGSRDRRPRVRARRRDRRRSDAICLELIGERERGLGAIRLDELGEPAKIRGGVAHCSSFQIAPVRARKNAPWLWHWPSPHALQPYVTMKSALPSPSISIAPSSRPFSDRFTPERTSSLISTALTAFSSAAVG